MKAKKLLGVVVGMMVIGGALTACGETQVEKVDTKKVAEQPAKKAEDKVFAVGDTVKVNGLEVTITKASFTQPNQYTQAEKGKVLTLDMTAKNTGESAFIDNTEFNLYDAQGNQLKEYFGYDEMAISGDVNKGKQLTGKLYFDVPQADSYELIYKPSFTLDNKEIKWNIKVQ
ncbi:DUF4352 domain-containing protein [Neobacillus vireti]|uniref:DUF4352 domain-containing protein n=1 Tax=Neobacillus vireti TaxID=220686 RepID=UPI0030001ECA